MSNEIIFKKIFEILSNKLGTKAEIKMNTALLGDGILDSMEFLKYLTVIEEEFGVSISEEDLEKKKLGIIVNMVKYLKK
jgi:acyl carrier protein